MVPVTAANWPTWTDGPLPPRTQKYIALHEHGRWILGAPAALEADRRVALAALPRGHRPRRPDRRLAPAERRGRGAFRPRARDLLLRQPLPDRRGGTVAGAEDGRSAG